jgi:hypothetical protein
MDHHRRQILVFELSGLGTSAKAAIENRAIQRQNGSGLFSVLISLGSRDFGVNYNSSAENDFLRRASASEANVLIVR